MDYLSLGKRGNEKREIEMKLQGIKGYLVYMILFILITVPVIIAPVFLYNHESFGTIQEFYTPFCHQLTSRSYCYFPETNSIEDCYSSSEFEAGKEFIVNKEGKTGYKFPVCARDVGFYLFALIGGFVMLYLKKQKETNVPNPLWLILVLIPFALDGGTQFIGLRESTNLIRMITGSLTGIVLPFYLVPMLNRFIR